MMLPAAEPSDNTVPIAAIQWQEIKEVRPGVRLVHVELEKPRLLKICVMRVDLTMKGLMFTGTGRDKDWGKPMPDKEGDTIHTLRTTTRDFMVQARKPIEEGGRGMKMIVATDTTPWLPWEAPWNHRYGHPVGLVVSDGVVVADDGNPEHPMFVVWKDGRVEITGKIDPAKKGEILIAHTGFAITMKDGVECDGGGYEHPLMPRMTYGLSQDGKYLFLVTVDGRQKDWSLGATGHEVCQIMRAAGAWNVVDMDGGGSASLCYWDDNANAPVMVNRHDKSGYARKVAVNLGICLP